MSPHDFPPLRTPRLRLRRFAGSDVEAFARYRSDPAVARYQGWEAPFPIDRARRFVAAMSTAPADVAGEWLQVAVALAEDDRLVGDCGFAPGAEEPRTVEIGVTLAAEHQRRGYAREAVSALLRYLFEDLAKHRVTACCDPRNAASVAVLGAVGMRREGHLVESTWSSEGWTDDLLFATLRREWVARQGPGRADGVR